MNKLNKIFLVLIIVLVIALLFSIFFCIHYVNATLTSNTHLCEVMKAIENKGFVTEMQEDGSIILVEGEVERSLE